MALPARQTSPNRSQAYRSDIDGLRAVSVVAVILFHSQIAGFTGGFVGVDVFFVISGYLITGVLLDDIERQCFSIPKFYERRVRRILPALFLLLASCIVVALLLLIPQDYSDFSLGVSATAAFASNILLWKQWGYFAAQSHGKPLLHTWSLAVEEQFYIFYPFLLAWIISFRRRAWMIAVVAAILLVSLLGSIWGAYYRPIPAFFMLPTRVWELLLGALLSLGLFPAIGDRRLREVVAAAGMVLIAGSVFLLSDSSTYPGVNSIPPCVGAMLVIYAGTDGTTSISRILATAPFRSIGLISYSLYLWNWPLLTFARIWLLRPLNLLENAIVIALSFGVAYLSWRYVEQPVRNRRVLPLRRSLFLFFSAAAVVLVSVGLGGYFERGFPQRFSPTVTQLGAYLNYDYAKPYHVDICYLGPNASVESLDWRNCVAPFPGMPNILTWGDSHAAHYVAGLEVLGAGGKFHVMSAWASGCLPFVDRGSVGRHNCLDFSRGIIERFEHVKPTAIVYSGHWMALSNERATDIAADIARTLKIPRKFGIPVILVGPSIEYAEPLPLILSRFALAGTVPRRLPLTYLRSGILDLDDALSRKFENVPGVVYVSPIRLVCSASSCPVIEAGVPIQFDDAHLTREGSVSLSRAIFPAALARVLGYAIPRKP